MVLVMIVGIRYSQPGVREGGEEKKVYVSRSSRSSSSSSSSSITVSQSKQ